MSPTMKLPAFLDDPLTERELDLIRTLKHICEIDNTNKFSSDTLRLHNLDRFFEDKQHDIGAFFAKMQHQKISKKVGRTRSILPSNHIREIRVYEFTENNEE